MTEVNKWPDIQLFHNIVKQANRYPDSAKHITHYSGKIKLHGTNAAVTLLNKNNQILPQSRTRLLSLENDNYGFAHFVKKNENFFKDVLDLTRACSLDFHADDDSYITIFGEWFGVGIQSKVACSKVEKSFAIFAIDYYNRLIVDPDDIKSFLCPHDDIKLPDNVYILPWYCGLEVDLLDRDRCIQTAELMNKLTLDVENCDPWIKSQFGIDGTGEGIVWYPRHGERSHHVKSWMIKTKGEKHGNVRKQKEPATIDPELISSINEFCNIFVTEPRLNQIANIVEVVDLKNTGEFLKQFNKDVLKESFEELTASNLEWKQVAGEISRRARTWWIDKCKKL